MYFGISAYFKESFFTDRFFDTLLSYYNELGHELKSYEFYDGETDRWKKTKKTADAKSNLLNSTYVAVNGNSENEYNGFSATLMSRGQNYFLPFDIQLSIESQKTKSEIFNLFCKSFSEILPDYAFLVYGDVFNRVQEELTFTPLSSNWMNESSEDKERENYLFNLQDLRPTFGKKISQLYPGNVFNKEVFDDELSKIKLPDWAYNEKNGYLITAHKELTSMNSDFDDLIIKV